MLPKLESEIVQLHQFFQDWFNGVLPFTEENFSRFEGVLDPDFILINPFGVILNRDELVESLRSAHKTIKGIRIWIEDSIVHQISEDISLATYQEWQEKEGHTTSRLSTAVFQSKPGTPNGFIWVHVHETWINS